ncbi:MAG: hypothetical protein JSU70_17405 [Phycisphaerales bacterium]|nr:MAG: hypothetical protein JSU70_17405 [Phycisphaerales bacterium]
MAKKLVITAFTVLLLVGGCQNTESGDADANKAAPEAAKVAAAYTFLLEKLQEDNLDSIASKDDDNLSLIRNIIRERALKIEVESHDNIEAGSDLCHYSKSTKKLVTIVDVTKRGESSYYVSYYVGPEGGASKEILLEERDRKWVVANDDGMWSVK